MERTSKYDQLRPEIEQQILEDRRMHKENPYAFRDENIIREYPSKHDEATLWRPAFVRDVEKVLHNPYYNRYSDKTQVFSFMKNDDISRRAQHVQLVARIARNMGGLLGLNTDLIEAIALGHDIGHTPFGHEGEYCLTELYQAHAGRYFNHNIQSARVFTTIFPTNLSLQTLDGIICHNGEMELQHYKPEPLPDFDAFYKKMNATYTDQNTIKKMIPSTLEGCVVRVCDIIAYLGKDRQDAEKIGFLGEENTFTLNKVGTTNAEIINNMMINIVNNSYGKDYLSMDPDYFEAFKMGKRENAQLIYRNKEISEVFEKQIRIMFERIYEELLSQMKSHDTNSLIYQHHINYIRNYTKHYPDRVDYEKEDANAIVVDYIASMTDDYFVDLYEHLFGKDEYSDIRYRGYFD